MAAPTMAAGPEAAQPPGQRPGRGRLWIGLTAIGAVLGVAFVKFVLPLIIVGVAGNVLDVAFGGPYMRLPGDVRSGFEQRLQAALGDSLNDLTEAQQSARIGDLVEAGLPRLGDDLVDSNFRLTSQALQAVDEASCATVGRAILAGTDASDAALSALVNTLPDADLRQWFEIRISAIEAEVRGSPDPIVIGDDAVNPLYDKLFVVMNQADIEVIGRAAGGETIEDGPFCAALRALYSSVLTLAPDEVLLFARYDVSP